MRLIIFGICLVIGVSAAFEVINNDSAEWENFKVTHGKQYDPTEELERQRIFVDNLNVIREHNKKYANGESTFYLGVNEYCDMTNEELKAKAGLKLNFIAKPIESTDTNKSRLRTKWSVDWRKEGAVTPVSNQQQCASFWAISAAGSIESQVYLQTGNLVPLSIQNLVDCSIAEGNKACFGGNVNNAFDYVIKNKGIDTETGYPYTGYTGYYCHYKKALKGASISGYVNLTSGSEDELEDAVCNVGPVSVTLDASPQTFQLYKGGIYKDENCSSTVLNHAGLVVGYDYTWTLDHYWIVKNSWGTSWGEDGYIRIEKKNNNMCGIASSASYPTL